MANKKKLVKKLNMSVSMSPESKLKLLLLAVGYEMKASQVLDRLLTVAPGPAAFEALATELQTAIEAGTPAELKIDVLVTQYKAELQKERK